MIGSFTLKAQKAAIFLKIIKEMKFKGRNWVKWSTLVADRIQKKVNQTGKE